MTEFITYSFGQVKTSDEDKKASDDFQKAASSINKGLQSISPCLIRLLNIKNMRNNA